MKILAIDYHHKVVIGKISCKDLVEISKIAKIEIRVNEIIFFNDGKFEKIEVSESKYMNLKKSLDEALNNQLSRYEL